MGIYVSYVVGLLQCGLIITSAWSKLFDKNAGSRRRTWLVVRALYSGPTISPSKLPFLRGDLDQWFPGAT